ncbi:hypothetical protein ABIA32_005565 [Streptacidiphilus sp. MAP12-20]|uniref:hypothetical protein n=1 Tax=Streptacidiphilus sp. MAP12-20 TaxID=3156299 RepID=UPI003518A39F
MSTPEQAEPSEQFEITRAAEVTDVAQETEAVVADPSTDPIAPPRKPGTVSPNEVRTQP